MVWRGPRLDGEMDREEGGIMGVSRSLLIVSTFAIASCAAQTTTREAAPALPTSEEVAAYTAAHWDEWHPRFARLAGREGAVATLVKVENVKCGYRYFTPECSFDVTADFAPADRSTTAMFSQFDRNAAGQIEETYVLYEARKR